MRTTLLPGLIDVLRTNLKRKQSRVRVFEVGRVFARRRGFAQPLRIGGLAFGASAPEQWGERTRAVDCSTSRAISKRLPRRCRSPRPSAPTAVRCTRAAALGARDWRTVGWVGELHPRLVRHFELPSRAESYSSSTSQR